MTPLTAYSLALLSFLVLTTPFQATRAVAQPAPRPTLGAMDECAAGHPLRIPLPENFEKIESDNPAVICIFRNKFEGFPTFNVVVEPRHEGTPPPTLSEYEEGIKRGYQSVGLADARLSDSEVGRSDGIPFFTSEVSFTNAGTAMKARILVLQLHDRTYTASAVGRSMPGSSELLDLIHGIQVDGVPLELSGKDEGLTGIIFTGIGVALTLLVAALWRKLRTRSPQT